MIYIVIHGMVFLVVLMNPISPGIRAVSEKLVSGTCATCFAGTLFISVLISSFQEKIQNMTHMIIKWAF
jgi:hypothetical protein